MMRKYLNWKNLTASIYVVIVLGIAYSAYSRSTGIVGVTRKGSDPGCTCHGSNPTPGVNIQWIGPDTVVTGGTANYSIIITGGPLVRAGTNIAVRRGTLATTDNSLRLESGELTHVSPKAPSGGNVTFAFRYTAPSIAALDTLFANGNSVDFTGDNGNDNWNFASNKRVVVVTASGIVMNPGVAIDFALSQNYPNPFNPETNIRFSIVNRNHTSLIVTDITGRVVETLVNETLSPGIYTAKFNASSMPSGIYFYRLTSGSNADVKKLTVLK